MVRKSLKYTLWLVIIPFSLEFSSLGFSDGNKKLCTEFLIGKTQQLEYEAPIISQSFSEDNRYLLSVLENGSLIMRDLKTQEEKIMKHPLDPHKHMLSAQWAEGHKVISVSGSSIYKTDYETGESQPLLDAPAVKKMSLGNIWDASISKGGTHILFDHGDGRSLLNIKTKTVNRIVDRQSNSYSLHEPQFSLDGKSIVYPKDEGVSILMNLENGSIREFKHEEGKVNSIAFSQNGLFMIKTLKGKDGDQVGMSFQSVENGYEKRETEGVSVLSQNLNVTVTIENRYPRSQYVVKDRYNQKQENYDIPFLLKNENMQFSPSGKNLIFWSKSEKGLMIHNLEHKKQRDLGIKEAFSMPFYSADEKWLVVQTSDHSAIVLPENQKVCIDKSYTVEKRSSSCEAEATPLVHQRREDIRSLNKLLHLYTDYCQNAFDEKKWEGAHLTPPDQLKDEISSEDALGYLLRFQKPGGFQPERHLPILVAILNSDLLHQESALIFGALQSVLYSSDQLYEDLIYKFPAIQSINSGLISPEKRCLTQDEEALLMQHSRNYLDQLSKKFNSEASFVDIKQKIRPLFHLIRKFSLDEKNQWLARFTEAELHYAKNNPKTKNIPEQRLYVFLREMLSPYFHLSKTEITDVIFSEDRQGGNIMVQLIGTQPIDGDATTNSQYGFFIKEIEPIQLPKKLSLGQPIANGKSSWTQGENKYEVRYAIDIPKEGLAATVPLSDKPDYEGLWKDNKFVSVFMPGVNILPYGGRNGTSAPVMDQVVTYYKQEGFNFEKPRQSNVDLEKFLKQKVISGELDLFWIEQHFSDPRYIGYFPKTVSILEAGRRTPEGKEEIAYILFPNSTIENEGSSFELSTDEYAEWLKKRTDSGGEQLIHLDTACWSRRKVVPLLKKTKDKNLLAIPALTTIREFSIRSENIEKMLLTGLRQQKSYREIRDRLSQNSEYNEHGQSFFIFQSPDDPFFKKHILSPLEIPIDIATSIFKKTGNTEQPYFMDRVREGRGGRI